MPKFFMLFFSNLRKRLDNSGDIPHPMPHFSGPRPLHLKRLSPVGASLLAMDVNDDIGDLKERGALAFFASKLAPTGNLRRE
ncbi:hypothetical protein EJA72_00935 [Pseudomonas sp. PB120]|nr:hypothetical protein [Pseudomonas sp. PB120]